MSATAKYNGALLKKRVGKWGKLTVKIILSGAAVWLFVLLLHLMQLWYAANPLLAGVSNNLAKSTRLPEKPNQTDGGVTIFWPHFPGSFHRTVHKMTINGVDTISEDWLTTSSAEDIIAYYKEQMVARGWQNNTEEDLQLQPENRRDDMGNNGLQSPEYVKKYSSLMDSSLILYRAPWSLQVMAVPSEKGIRQTSVRVFAAATPSIKEFCMSIGEGAFKADGAGLADGAIDTVQESGGQRCHTIIAIKNERPVQIFNEMLKEYHDKNWHSMIFNQARQSRSTYCAWLVNGQSYAALSVKALPQGNSCSVTLTEVTPAK